MGRSLDTEHVTNATTLPLNSLCAPCPMISKRFFLVCVIIRQFRGGGFHSVSRGCGHGLPTSPLPLCGHSAAKRGDLVLFCVRSWESTILSFGFYKSSEPVLTNSLAPPCVRPGSRIWTHFPTKIRRQAFGTPLFFFFSEHFFLLVDNTFVGCRDVISEGSVELLPGWLRPNSCILKIGIQSSSASVCAHSALAV